MDETSEDFISAAVSPIRQAVRMTGIFIGPGLLGLMLLGAFFGSLNPLKGSATAIETAAPDSWRICISAGKSAETKEQTFVVVPHSFEERVLFTASIGSGHKKTASVELKRSSTAAFYVWLVTLAVALFLTVFVSAPTLFRLFRPSPALLDCSTEPDSTEDAQL